VERTTGNLDLFMNRLRRAAERGHHVQIHVHLARVRHYQEAEAHPGTVSLFEKGGWRAREALDYIEAAGAGRRGVAAIEAGLRAMVLAKPGVGEASGVEAVQMPVMTD
jgi:hypothetical protein